MKNIKSIIFNSESFKFDDSNYAKLDQVNNYQQAQVFTDNGIRLHSTTIVKDANPTPNRVNSLRFYDKNGKIVGLIQFQQDAYNNRLQFAIPFLGDTQSDYYVFNLQLDKVDGRGYCVCPHPRDTASGKEVVTAQWVRNLLTRNGYTLNS